MITLGRARNAMVAFGRCLCRKNERWSIAEALHEKSQLMLASFKLSRLLLGADHDSDAGDVQNDLSLSIETHSTITHFHQYGASRLSAQALDGGGINRCGLAGKSGI